MKKLRKLLCVGFAAIALSSLSVGIANLSTATAVAEEPITYTDVFTMDEGASVRKQFPVGIRFTTFVSNDLIREDRTFGTLVIPTDMIPDGQTLDINTTSAINIEATNWKVEGNDTTLWEYTGVVVGQDNKDLNVLLWDRELTAVGYYYDNDDTSSITYTTDQIAPQARSLAQVAARALQEETPTYTLTHIVDTVVDSAKDTLSIPTTITENTALPSAINNVSIAWEITNGNEIASIVDNTINVVDPLMEGMLEVRATLTCGTANATKDFSIEVKKALSNATLSFADTTNRVSCDDDKQVWSQNGITFTNDKGASTTNVADYSNPVRLYKNSTVTIEGLGIKAIEFTCNTADYATDLSSSIPTADGVTVTTNDQVVTVTLDSATNLFTISSLSAQVRINSITVNPVEPTDAEKVNTEKDALIFENKTLSFTLGTDTEKTLTLPVTPKTYNDVAITWSEVNDLENVTIEGDTLTVTNATEPFTFEITATFRLGEESAESSEYTITVEIIQSGEGGGEEVTTITNTYTFSDYAAGTQYAENEAHVLDEYVTVTTTNCHFTSELRIYSSSTYNGYAIIKSAKAITEFSFNAGNKVDILNVYGSIDGSTWTLIEGVSITSTSYKDYTVSADFSYTYLKLDVNGSNQVRVKSITLTMGELSDADKAAAQIAALTLEQDTIALVVDETTSDTLSLPDSYTWDIVGDVTGIEAAIENNTLTVTLPGTIANETATFTVTIKATLYVGEAEATKEFTITVNVSPKPEEGGGEEAEPVTVSTTIKDYAAANGWSNSVKYTTINMDSNITVTATGTTNTGKYYTSGYEWRIYQTENPSIVIKAVEGKTIKSVKITYNISNTGILTLNGTTISSDDVVEVNANSITFGVGNSGTKTNGQVKITAIEVVYA